MIAVIGANGLLGSFIAKQLLLEGVEFVALKRTNSDTSNLKEVLNKIQWRDADVTDPVSLQEALSGVTGVIHTAALVSFNPRRKKELYNINVLGTRNVVDACLLLGIKRMLHISSVAALGRQKGQTVIDENNKWVESSFNTEYGRSKYEAELEVFRGQEEGLSTICINPSVILSQSNWNNSSAQLFKYVWKQKPFYIDGHINYVDVRDVAELTLKLYFSEIENDRFIVSAGSIGYKEFFNEVAVRFGKKGPHIKLGPATAKFLGNLEYLRSVLTGADPLITRETARNSKASFLFDNQKVKKELNFEFQSIDSTLDWCCEYYKKLNGAKNE